MKSFVKAVAVAAVVVAPAFSFAQSDSSPTRAQVKQDLQRVEAAGYEPGGDRTTYPADVQAAESRASHQRSAAGMNSYGGAVAGRSAAGMRMMPPLNDDGQKPLYFGH